MFCEKKRSKNILILGNIETSNLGDVVIADTCEYILMKLSHTLTCIKYGGV